VAAFWTQWLEQSSRGPQALLEMMKSGGDPQQVVGAMQSAVDPKQVHQNWLDAVARSIDDFMRSPAFLEIMKQNLKSVTDVKGLQNQVVQGTARELGMPLAGDITGLFERLQSTEQTILNRLRAIEDRLEAIEAKH
jgi:hypothetical protein